MLQTTCSASCFQCDPSRRQTRAGDSAWLVLVAIVTIFAASMNRDVSVESSESEPGLSTAEPIVKSSHDEREYRSFVLANGLRVLTVSDRSATKCAAAVDCAVGSNHDPPEFEGLAHLLEHLLFMGSRQHPQENGYIKFLSDNGGFANAMTSSEHTNLYMEVNSAQLRPALDMLAHALRSPLLDVSTISREVLAVDAEYSKNMHSDRWRIMQLVRRLADPRHPFARIGAGNYASLMAGASKADAARRLQLALRSFHATHYTAPNLVLSLVGPQDSAVLRRLATELFSPIAQATAARTSLVRPGDALGMPFSTLGKRIDFLPVGEEQLLHIMWPVQPLRLEYASKPAAYFSHILGHEGNNTLSAYLMRTGLVEGLTAGSGVELISCSMLKLVVRLTASGLRQVDAVIALIFDYIARVRVLGAQRWVFDEVSRLSQLRFDFADKSQPADLASALANNMHYFAVADLLRAPSVLWEWAPRVVDALLAQLTPANALILVGSQSFAQQPGLVADAQLGTSYRLTPIGNLQRKQLGDELLHNFSLPEPNPYLGKPYPSSTNTAAAIVDTKPQLVEHGGQTKLWHVQTNAANWPKATVFIHLINPAVLSAGPRQTVLSALTQLVWEDNARPAVYAAKVAGVHFSLGSSPSGFVIKVHGFAQYLPSVLETVLSAMFGTLWPSAAYIDRKVDMLRNVYRSIRHGQPLRYAQYLQKQLLRKHTWPHDELECALDNVTRHDIVEWMTVLRAQFTAEALVYGAVPKSNASRLMQHLERTIGLGVLDESVVPIQALAQLSSPALLSASNPNSADATNKAVTKFWELGDETPKARVLLQILGNLASESFFTQIRSKEQLGYSVACHASVQHGRLGLLAQVQSRAHNTSYISARVDAWLYSFAAQIGELTAAQFYAHLGVVLRQLQPTEESHSVRADRLWREIREGEYNFERRAEQLEATSGLVANDLLLLLHGAWRTDGARKLTGAAFLRSIIAALEVRVQPAAQDAAQSLMAVGAEIRRLRHSAIWPTRMRRMHELRAPARAPAAAPARPAPAAAPARPAWNDTSMTGGLRIDADGLTRVLASQQQNPDLNLSKPHTLYSTSALFEVK